MSVDVSSQTEGYEPSKIRIPGGVYGCLELIGRSGDGWRQRSSFNMTPWFDTDNVHAHAIKIEHSLTMLSLYTTALIHHVP
jgi:hypothetical protein